MKSLVENCRGLSRYTPVPGQWAFYVVLFVQTAIRCRQSFAQLQIFVPVYLELASLTFDMGVWFAW